MFLFLGTAELVSPVTLTPYKSAERVAAAWALVRKNSLGGGKEAPLGICALALLRGHEQARECLFYKYMLSESRNQPKAKPEG